MPHTQRTSQSDQPRQPDPQTLTSGSRQTPHGYIIGTRLRFDGIIRILVYEYLPRTPANLELADIEAQHPNATR
jgi:hypothetical protein